MNNSEQKYVYDVYNQISDEFDATRQYPWPVVKSFIDNLPSNSLVCDVGSGNGKNMYRSDLVFCATDFSEKMCSLSQKKSTNVVQSNILCLPYKDNIFDAVICIACVHHLNTYERRKKAINECKRIMKPDGNLLISVWANSEKYGKGDQYIKWNTHDTSRYYHLFDEKELNAMCDFNHETIYNRHNYYIKI